MQLEIPDKYGLVLAVLMAFWIQQNVIFVIPVVQQRGKTGLQAPTLYPTDSQIKDLKLSPDAVDAYLRAQRVHQNNMEFLHMFIPVFLVAGLGNAEHVAVAGALVWLGRLVTAMGYWMSAKRRIYGAWFHIPEFYIVYLAGLFTYEMAMKTIAA